MTAPLPALPGVAYAEVNHGRWLARCATPWCFNAMALTFLQDGFVCDECRLPMPVQWPADPLVITRLLALRPHPASRNWLPGETVEELLMENTAHGIIPPEWHELTGRTLMLSTVEDRVMGGLAAELPYDETAYRMLEDV